MARNEIVLSIFLASPGDLASERERVAEVVHDWNRSWSRNLGIRLELLRWEDDAYSGIGEDAQAVINQQIPFDWDFFIGLMWSRFGTPTGRAGSGTQEEFDRALARRKTAAGPVNLLFYFKDAPISPSKLDLDQLQKVLDFKRSVQSSGLLSWDFSDIDQFAKIINLHLTKHVQDWRNNSSIQETSTPAIQKDVINRDAPVKPSVSSTDDGIDDSGFLDLSESFSDEAEKIKGIADRLHAAQETLTENMVRGREELEKLQGSSSAVSPKKYRASIARVADEMLRYTSTVESETPLLRNAFDESSGIVTKLILVSAEIYSDQLEEIEKGILPLTQQLALARQSTEGLKNTTTALPRMTKELNFAKRKQAAALDSLIVEFQNGESLFTEALALLEQVKKDRGNEDDHI